MADFKKLRWMPDRLKTTPRVTIEDLKPSVGWTEDHERHQMLVDLPGFKEGDIKHQGVESGTIAISGGRRVSDTKRVQFERTVKAPEDADTTNISMKFVGDTLELSMPKVVKRKGKEPEVQNERTSTDLGEEKREGFGSSKEAKEKEEQGVQNEAESSDSEAKEKEEQEVQKEAQGSDSRDESQSGNAIEEKQEPEQEPQKEDSHSDLREGIEKAEKEKEEPEMKDAQSSSDLRDEVHEESEISESAKVTAKKEPEAQTVASDGNVAEQKRDELKERKDEAEDKQDEHEKEENFSSSAEKNHEKGKDIAHKEDAQQKSIIGKLIDHKAILLASIISFTLGVLLSPKFHKPPQK